MTARSGALVFGLLFITLGALGFIDNPIVGANDTAIFHADKMHNWVHIISGILFMLVALAAPGSARGFLILFGIVYLTIGVLGFISFGITGMGKVLGILHVNGADNLLHIGLGVVIALAGLTARSVSANY